MSAQSMPVNHDAFANIHARIAQRTIHESIAQSIDLLRKKLPSYIGPRAGLAYPGSPFLNESPGKDFVSTDPNDLPKAPLWPIAPGDPKAELSKFHVGIVGGGMAGLYTAMMLKNLGISYEIIEASSRTGGRVYTHRFSTKPGDYYDVGAMRYPEIALMRRTFDLFLKRLKIERDPTARKQGALIPYFFSGPGNPWYFNNILTTSPAPGGDEFCVSEGNGGKVPDKYVKMGVDKILEIVFGPWKKEFFEDFEGAWKRLMELDAQSVSVRQEIMRKLGDEDDKIDPRRYYISNWCETMNASTCHYDQAFASLLMRSLVFNSPVDPTPTNSGFGELNRTSEAVPIWWCLNGGADIVAEGMVAIVGKDNAGRPTITKNTRVTAISRSETNHARPMRVQCIGPATADKEEKHYSHVITTTTTTCLQTMDLRGAEMDYAQREAIRLLRYDNSVKLGIKFTNKWWISKGITRAGLGKTDRPTRIVVYPSYALDDPADKEGVLLACYNLSTDASRIGSLSIGSDPTAQERILDVVIQDLALMHELDPRELRCAVMDHHFHDWNRDEFTAGAFGMFGPGQFATLFPLLQQPAARGNLFFVGEFTSIYHGWIEGALNSAYRGVHQMLVKEGDDDLRKKLEDNWGIDPEYEPNPEGAAGWQVFFGSLEPELKNLGTWTK